MTQRDIARLIDHSLLHPALTDAEVRQGCALARAFEVKAVCVKPCSIPIAKEVLAGSPVAIATVAGFPHGSAMAQTKVREAQDAVFAGAHEIDMVINVGKALSGAFDYVKDEIRAVQRACQRTGTVLKVIFENDFLPDTVIVELCRVSTELNVDFVKTSTGYGFVKQADGTFSSQGATAHQVALMRRHCAPHVRIKAAGGIRTLDQVLEFQALGCARIGTAATAAILDEAKARGL